MNSAQLFKLLYAGLITVVIGSPAIADDTEIFFGSSSASTGSPNILLVLDTSGSMGSTIPTTSTYDPKQSYTGNCSSSYVYFKNSKTNTLPTCASDGTTSNAQTNSSVNSALRGHVSLSDDFYCSPATSSGGSFDTSGYISVAGIRWTKTTSVVTGRSSSTTETYAWSNNLNPADETSTSGRRGSTTTTTTTYTRNGIACKTHDYASSSQYPNTESPTASTQWTSTSGNSYWDPADQRTETTYTFYNANYLNYYNEHRTSTTQSRLQIVRDAAKNLIGSLSGVNVGLMRYDSSGSGGMVTNAIKDVATGKSAMETELDTWRPEGNTPLSETLWEAYRYYAGQGVAYGNNSHKYNCTSVNSYGVCSSGGTTVNYPSVAASRTDGSASSNTYQSPFTQSCQKSHIVFLTDGLPTYDDASDSSIEGLDSSKTNCYSTTSAMWSAMGGTPSGTSGGRCLKALSSYMYENDLINDSTLTDTQNITTHFIGFGSDVAGGVAYTYLKDAAQAGGGNAYTATDLDTLTETLNKIVLGVLDQSTTFTSPSVAVNAFNKTQVLEDLYVSVFEPTELYHWPGNMKKYKLRDSMIVGQDTSTSAVDDSTGFFKDNSQSYWSTEVDGAETTIGGAASKIPDPASRKVYTYIGSDPTIGSWTDLTGGNNYSLADANTLLTDSVLELGDSSDPARTTLIDWARGMDTQDEDGDGNKTEARHVMGDPVHSQPAVVIYGKDGSTTTEKLNDALVFIATNDGYLHAMDVSTGVEQWAFIPQEVLGDLKQLYTNPSTGDTKHYSLDGNIRVLKYDVDNDGVVEPSDGDSVFLYFSMGRGGPNYYALDVTSKDRPKYMWTLDSSELGGIVTQSWSTPALGRVRVDGATQNSQRLVLIFGGGYDPAEYSVSYNSSGNTYGKGIFMVDSVRGTVLWSQTKTSDGSAFDKMTHAIPSNVAILDINGDDWTDRMYVGDMAGQLWRFDITSGNSAGTLVTGGVIASLGAKGASSASDANNRSFYNEPDIAKMVVSGGASFYNVALGSGDRDRPKSNTSTEDRFYSVWDRDLGHLSQSDYNNYTAVLDTDLTSVTGESVIDIGSHGWKLALSSTDDEKSLSQSTTTDAVVTFTTYIPNNSGTSTSCTPSTGTARSYSVSVATGYKYFDTLYETYNTSGLPSQTTVVNEADIIRTDGTDATDDDDDDNGDDDKTLCMSGVTILGNCVSYGSRIRTFWREAGAD